MKRLLIFSVLILASSLSFAKATFVKGYYVDIDENKIEGYLFYRFDHKQWFKFKSDLEGEAKKISTDDCKEFVLELGKKGVKFIVRKDLKVSTMPLTTTDFVEVLAVGEINLYRHYGQPDQPSIHDQRPTVVLKRRTDVSGAETLFIENEDKEMILVPKKLKRFKKKVVPLFDNCFKIDETHKKKRLSTKQLKQVVENYNLCKTK